MDTLRTVLAVTGTVLVIVTAVLVRRASRCGDNADARRWLKRALITAVAAIAVTFAYNML